VRILTNHACATGTQHDQYHVVQSGGREVVAAWPRVLEKHFTEAIGLGEKLLHLTR